MSRPFITFMFIVVCAPVLFYAYLMVDLVCAPRAMAASTVFGAVPLALLTAALVKQRRRILYASLAVLGVEVIVTPIIMIHRLGWDMFVNERLLAFFTFEGIAIAQIVLVILIRREMRAAGAREAS